MLRPAYISIGLFAALYAAQALAQMEFATFPGTDIAYKIKTEIDTRNPEGVRGGALGNAYLKVFVTLKNNANQKRKLILCLYGKSIRQDNNRTSALRGVDLTYDTNAKQFTCAPSATTTMKRSRFGNMGCQLVTVDAMAETVVTFLTGSSPGVQRNPIDPPPNADALAMQITGNQVVQDGNRRDINGAGQLPGHRMTTSQPTFGKASLYSVLDRWILQLLVLKDEAIDLGCMKKEDVTVQQGEEAYTPPCTTPVEFGKACNKCFGMNTYISKVDPPDMVMRSISSRDVSETVPMPKKEVGLLLPADPGTDGAPRNVVLTLTYIPGQEQPPNVLQECDPVQEGCFETVPPPNQSFPLPQDGPIDYGTLAIHFPSTVPGNFSADFLATLSDLLTGDVLVQNWIRVRPRLICDINEDGQVDSTDVNMIFQAIGSLAGADSAFDVDGDGLITVNDARVCVSRCTKPLCAP